MPPPQTADSGHYRPFTKVVGTEPLPGYRLLEPLGRGGFGEVWKCEAPGGLMKAIKFVPGAKAEDGQGERRLNQELDAFQQIKAIRHPFLLTLERVEMIDGELVMVMELADRQLQDRFRECRNCGLPGIPRDELLAYFADAAEALDMISAKFGLQHLDVKPANLFLVSGHVKVGDYGLVASLDADGTGQKNRGLTPKYVAPEALRGVPSNRSDQYSLALVYQELLTGTFPYTGKSAQQIMIQHASAIPDVTPLPSGDRPIVMQALAKDPAARYGSCLGFMQALLSVSSATSLPGAAMDVRRARVERSRAEVEELPLADALEASEMADATGERPPAEATDNVTLPGTPHVTTPAVPNHLIAKLIPTRKSGATPPAPPRPTATPAPPRPPAAAPSRPPAAPPSRQPGMTPSARPLSSDYIGPATTPTNQYAVTLDPIKSVVPSAKLQGLEARFRLLSADQFAAAVVKHAAAGAHAPQMPGDVGRLPDGTCVAQFPSTVPAQVVAMKLDMLRETWGVTIEQPNPTRVLLRRSFATGGGFWRKKTAGLEVAIHMPPPGQATGEMTVTGRLVGDPDRESIMQAQDVLPKLLAEVRRELKNVEDRRKHPRLLTDGPVSVYPIHSAGGIEVPIPGHCLDVSLGGVCLVVERHPSTKYVYVTFDDVEAVANQAILVRMLRMQTNRNALLCAGMYRTDL
jgi:eukaryotic-like serine/threonine-protein kinase